MRRRTRAIVLVLLYDAHSGGLALRPWHRVVRGVRPGRVCSRRAARRDRVERIAQSDALLTRLALGQSSPGGGVFGVWTRDGGVLLTVGSTRADDLDVDVVSDTLPQMIGSTADELSAAGRLSYVSDAREAVASVDAGRADVCFLLRPTPVEAVLSVAAAGGFMPAKSTFFHPKAATGLVFNPLAE